jgi:hypothetical protein
MLLAPVSASGGITSENKLKGAFIAKKFPATVL